MSDLILHRCQQSPLEVISMDDGLRAGTPAHE